MDRKAVRIVFMGTPEFAEHSLERLVSEGFNVVGVVTVPDRPIGRHGSVLQPSPVKQFALSAGIPVLQPEKLKDETFLEQLRAWKADLQVVVAFRMLPEVVWAMPPMGTFNLHASLLPQYRGAAPINWAVMNGEKETGVTTFFLKHEIDTGDIISQRRVAVGEDEDAGSLHDRLMAVGADLVVETLDDIVAGRASAMPQDVTGAAELKPAPKIFKETCMVDWSRDALSVKNFVRGLSPYPAAWSVLVFPDGRRADMKIFRVSLSDSPAFGIPGTVHSDGRNCIEVMAGDGHAVRLDEVQMAGKKRMDTRAFLCGTQISDGCLFE